MRLVCQQPRTTSFSVVCAVPGAPLETLAQKKALNLEPHNTST